MRNHIEYEISKELGECYLFMGEHAKAAEYYNKAIVCNVEATAPYLGLAAIAVAKGELQEAYTLYAKAESLQSSDRSSSGLGMIAQELGHYEEALEHYTRSLHHNPGDMFAINSMVQISYVLGRLENLIPYLEASLAAQAGDVEAIRYALAGCLAHLGRTEEARKHLEALLGHNPGNNMAQQLYAQIAA